MRLLPIKGLLPEELDALAVQEGAPRFAGRQLLRWLYRRPARSFQEMNNLSRDFRTRLAQRYRIEEASVTLEQRAADGTTKMLIKLADGAHVESVLIPEPHRVTLCVSTQVGCARGCVFCATARMKLQRNLSAAEILEQVVLARQRAPVSNIVFMGMGEPLDNYDAVRRSAILLTEPHAFGLGQRHVTISTVGVVPSIRKLAEDRVPGRLTVSLAAPHDELRSRLLPVNRLWPIAELLRACQEYTARTRRQVTLAYVLLRGVNDAPAQALRLAGLAHQIRAKVNLIPYNPMPALDPTVASGTADFSGFEPSSDEAVTRFQAALKSHAIHAFVRRERGGDIAAACGQLAILTAPVPPPSTPAVSLTPP